MIIFKFNNRINAGFWSDIKESLGMGGGGGSTPEQSAEPTMSRDEYAGMVDGQDRTGILSSVASREGYATPEEVRASETERSVENDLNDFFGDIEFDEDLIQSGAFAPESSGGLTAGNLLGFSKETRPTYDAYLQKYTDLDKKFGPDLENLSDKEKAAVSYLSSSMNSQVEKALMSGASGAIMNPVSGLLNGIIGLKDVLLKPDSFLDSAATAIGLSEEEKNNVSNAWNNIRTKTQQELNKDQKSISPEGGLESDRVFPDSKTPAVDTQVYDTPVTTSTEQTTDTDAPITPIPTDGTVPQGLLRAPRITTNIKEAIKTKERI